MRRQRCCLQARLCAYSSRLRLPISFQRWCGPSPATLAPTFSAEFGLTPADLGLLAGAYDPDTVGRPLAYTGGRRECSAGGSGPVSRQRLHVCRLFSVGGCLRRPLDGTRLERVALDGLGPAAQPAGAGGLAWALFCVSCTLRESCAARSGPGSACHTGRPCAVGRQFADLWWRICRPVGHRARN